MPRERTPLKCHGCGEPMPRVAGADLHHGPSCAVKHENKIKRALKALVKACFRQSKKIPNVWLKDAVAITLDQVLHHGLEETLAKHKAAVGAISSSQARPAERPAGTKSRTK